MTNISLALKISLAKDLGSTPLGVLLFCTVWMEVIWWYSASSYLVLDGDGWKAGLN